MSSSNREKFRQNREKLAAACEQFGYLTTQQVADLIFPEKPSGLRLAQRLIATLIKDAWLVAKRDRVTLEQRVANGQNGITFLRERGVNAARGTDTLRYESEHRIASNTRLIYSLNEGLPRVISERQIQQAARKSWLGKVPDGLVLRDDDDDGANVIWIEVENSRRDKKRFEELRSFLEKVGELSENLSRHPEIEGTTLDEKRLFLTKIEVYATRKECDQTLDKLRQVLSDNARYFVQYKYSGDKDARA